MRVCITKCFFNRHLYEVGDTTNEPSAEGCKHFKDPKAAKKIIADKEAADLKAYDPKAKRVKADKEEFFKK